MRKVALLVAVETYTDVRIPKVHFAEADATSLSDALQQHGFQGKDNIVVVSPLSTKTTIESTIRTTVAGLAKEDTFYFYYAGHGFAKDGKNYITCVDTRLDDLADTSISIEWLFLQFKRSNCKRIVML